jgi:hypothetical protein
MRIIIKENKLYDVFVRFMESQYDLVYNLQTREFIDKNGKIFGWVNNTNFLYTNLKIEDGIKSFFGSGANKLLLHYLQNRFPGITILSIED